MGRGELERLSKEELIELVLRLQRPEKTSRTSSKPPSTDRKEQREKSKPGGAKPGHGGHSRTLSELADRVVDHRPEQCPCCQVALASDLPAEPVSVHEGPAVSARPEYPMPMWTFVERTRVLSHRNQQCGSFLLFRALTAASDRDPARRAALQTCCAATRPGQPWSAEPNRRKQVQSRGKDPLSLMVSKSACVWRNPTDHLNGCPHDSHLRRACRSNDFHGGSAPRHPRSGSRSHSTARRSSHPSGNPPGCVGVRATAQSRAPQQGRSLAGRGG